MKVTKYLILSAIFFLVSTSFLKAQSSKDLALELVNNTSIAYHDKVVEIPWTEIIKISNIDTARLIVLDATTNKQLIYQLEDKGLATIQNLLVQVDIPSKKSKKIILSQGDKMVFEPKTFGRFVPERKDDFAWENDKIAFRMYGKALESTPKEMAYGTDVWVKRTERLIINERYKRGEYHVDHGDGLDYYHVGLSLGAGGLMPFYKDSIYFSRNYTDYQILDNGPLRTTFKLVYDEWETPAGKISAEKTISLDAGSQLNKINVDFTSTKPETIIPVVAGIITRNKPGIKYLDEKQGIMSYWEPEHDQDGVTAVACIMTSPVEFMTEKYGQLLAKTNTNTQQNITYYSGAAWNKAGTFTDNKKWLAYLYDYKTMINKPVTIKFNIN